MHLKADIDNFGNTNHMRHRIHFALYIFNKNEKERIETAVEKGVSNISLKVLNKLWSL